MSEACVTEQELLGPSGHGEASLAQKKGRELPKHLLLLAAPPCIWHCPCWLGGAAELVILHRDEHCEATHVSRLT
jgi:hypothetical protein